MGPSLAAERWDKVGTTCSCCWTIASIWCRSTSWATLLNVLDSGVPRLVRRGPRRFRLQSLHILHVRCKFCVIRAVGRNLHFLHVWLRLRENSIEHRDGQAQERAQEKLERNRRWFERKKSTSLVRAANAPVRAANAPFRAANAPYGELHTSTNSLSLDHERGEHTTRRLCTGRRLGQSRTNLCRSKALRWPVRLSTFDTSFCSGSDCADIVKTSLLACSRWRRRRRFDKGVELSIADLLPKTFVSFPPKDEVVRLRSTQQPSALSARRLLECNQPCTDRKCHVALKQRKALNFAFIPTRIQQSRRRSLRAMQQLARAKVPRQGLDFFTVQAWNRCGPGRRRSDWWTAQGGIWHSSKWRCGIMLQLAKTAPDDLRSRWRPGRRSKFVF